ncbi:cell division protein FtsL [Burkholderiaceae bacterium UC74_6]
MIGRLNFILLLAVLASGLWLVHSAYDVRRLFTAVDEAAAEGRRLESDRQRLEAERHAQATNLRVDKVARERLLMTTITPAVTKTVGVAGAAPVAISAASGASQ